jgi:putative addiction module component (TIGR02574 family)
MECDEANLEEQSETLPVPTSHKDELDRRLAAQRDNPKAGSNWEEVRTRLLKQGESDS